MAADLPPPVAIAPPPATYVHRYDGPISFISGTQAETQRRCEALRTPHAANRKIYGCMVWLNPAETDITHRMCVIYLATDQHPRTVLDVEIHELAHCNGWRHDEDLPGHAGSSTKSPDGGSIRAAGRGDEQPGW